MLTDRLDKHSTGRRASEATFRFFYLFLKHKFTYIINYVPVLVFLKIVMFLFYKNISHH